MCSCPTSYISFASRERTQRSPSLRKRMSLLAYILCLKHHSLDGWMFITFTLPQGPRIHALAAMSAEGTFGLLMPPKLLGDARPKCTTPLIGDSR